MKINMYVIFLITPSVK